MIGYVHIQFEDTVLVSIVQGGYHIEIADMGLGLCEQEHIPFNAAHAPKVLAFQVRAGAPAEYLENQRILSRFQVVVD